MHDVEISKLKDTHSSSINELHSTQRRDLAEMKSKLSGQLKSLQEAHDLAEEEHDSEVQRLRSLLEATKTSHSDEIAIVKQELDGYQLMHEKDKQREKERVEHLLQGLQSQLDELHVAKKHSEEQCNGLEGQLMQEREGRFQALQKARAAEEDLDNATNAITGLKQDIEVLNRKLKETGGLGFCNVIAMSGLRVKLFSVLTICNWLSLCRM
jgi:chromosome segregation ATPase